MKTVAIILASDRENRMQSEKAKELHDLMGRTLMQCTIDHVSPVAEETIVVLGHHAAELTPALPDTVRTAVQDFSLGQGTAKTAQAGAALLGEDTERVLITAADMPLISAESYHRLAEAVDGVHCRAAVLYADVDAPGGYDRVLFDGDGFVRAIAPVDDLMPHEEDMPSINTSVYCFTREALLDSLSRLMPEDTGLWRLSGLIALMAKDGDAVAAVPAYDPREALRIVTRKDLASAIRYMKTLNCEKHMRSGVTIIDPGTTYIESDVTIGGDTILYPGCFLQNGTRIGCRCRLLPGCRLQRAVLGDDVTAESSVLVDCQVEAGQSVGPFASIKGSD